MDINSPMENNFRLLPKQKSALKKLGILSPEDLLYHFPSRYESFSKRKNICDIKEGDKTIIFGEVLKTKTEKTFRKGLNISEVEIGDMTGTIRAVWFNQPYIAKMIKEGDKLALSGKVSKDKYGLHISNPDYEKINNYEALGEGGEILPIYPETTGISSKWLRYAIQKTLKKARPEMTDPLPKKILEKYNLPSLHSSFIFIHKPQNIRDAEAARKRFSFEEIFFIQLARLIERKERDEKKSIKINIDKKELDNFLATFPFQLTAGQKKAINDVAKDISANKPMSRLLEGDVGSGKTAVAVAAAYMALSSDRQTAYMAPTEILARQHFESFMDYFSKLRLTTKIGLITSSECRKFPSKVSPNESTPISKAQLLKWVESGEIPILIGTHSLIQKGLKFKNLAMVVIDEQHRFGTKQRASIVNEKSESTPHLLSMTATPIPRTLALTIYGDLDLSLLDELPVGRRKIITEIVSPSDRQKAYEKIKEEIINGRQAYIICPRIEEPDPEKLTKLNVKAVKEEAKRLEKEIFPELNIGILHGKMTPKEKDESLEDFKTGKTHILVATSVVEVGINVPNATIIIIEGAERFGLAQLHQLRGRVMRSSYQPHCFVFTDNPSQKTFERLKAFKEAKNGFELSEYDLKLRGAGELGGGKQWGISDVGMDALKNLKMVEAARSASQELIKEDPNFDNHPNIILKLQNQNKKIHFE